MPRPKPHPSGFEAMEHSPVLPIGPTLAVILLEHQPALSVHKYVC